MNEEHSDRYDFFLAHIPTDIFIVNFTFLRSEVLEIKMN